MILSSSQQSALNTLLPIARLAISESMAILPIQPRTHSLVCGPSGSGKSFLMRKLGDILNIPVLHLNVSSWIPVGARSGEPTWDRIVEFLEKNEAGIIVLDEIDKISSTSSDWLGFVRLEIYDLLDGRIPQSVSCGGSLW